MEKLLFISITSLLVLASCSTSQRNSDVSIQAGPASRKVASLDNNGDDSFDGNLESYFGGSAASEEKANDELGNVIRGFIEAQKQIRHDKFNSSDVNKSAEQRVFNDLPKPDYATRDVHRKTNGCLKGELEIANDLMQRLNSQIVEYEGESGADAGLSRVSSEDELGVFGHGRIYDTVIRFSNGNPGNRPDKTPDARGFAVKILPKGTLSEHSIADSSAEELNKATQLDILSINFPTFFMSDPIRYAAFNRVAMVKGSMDFKNSIAGQMDAFRALLLSGKLTALERELTLAVNGSVIFSPFYQEYFSMVPSRLGPEGVRRAVKYSWQPVACPGADVSEFEKEKKVQWADWTKEHDYLLPAARVEFPYAPYTSADFSDDYLRAHVADRITKGDFCFDLFVQLYRDPVSTNIEDSTDLWARTTEEKSWWTKTIVPSSLVWGADPDNQESRADYLARFEKKQIAPAIFAGKLSLKQVPERDIATVAENSKTCEDLSFNPWNGDIAHHKPLGITSRMKRRAYNASRMERHKLNGIDDINIERGAR